MQGVSRSYLSKMGPDSKECESSGILRFLLIFAFIVDARFACIISLPGILGEWTSSNWSKELVCIIAVVIFISYFIRYRSIVLNRLSCFLPVYLLLLLTVCVIEIVYSMKVMGSPLFASVKSSEVAYFILALPLLIQMIIDGSCKKMMNLLTVIATFCAVAMLAQSIYFTATGGILFSAMTNTTGTDVAIREFGIRFSPPGGLLTFAAIYSVIAALFLSEDLRSRFPYIASGTLLVSAIVTVYQTRMEDIALIGSLLLAIILCAENGKLSKGLKRILVALLVGLVLGMGSLESFFSSFSATNSAYSGSTTIRAYAYTYYFEKFLNYPLFGFGSLPSTSSLLHGNGTAYISDVGIVGLSAQWGIMFIALYAIFFWRMIFVYWRTKDAVGVFERALMLAVIIYLLLTSATLCCFSPALGIRVVIALALFELINSQNKGERKVDVDA